MILKIFSPEKMVEKSAVLTQIKTFKQKKYHSIGFQENRQYFWRKLVKIAENNYRNIYVW
jgi:hypothetical protein